MLVFWSRNDIFFWNGKRFNLNKTKTSHVCLFVFLFVFSPCFSVVGLPFQCCRLLSLLMVCSDFVCFFALVLSRINQGNKQLQFSCDFDYFILQLPFTQGNPSSKDVTGARHKLLCFFNIYLKEGITALVVFLRFETKRHIKCNKSSTKFISATR